MNNRTRNRLIGIIAMLLIIIVFFPYMGKKSAFEKEKEIALTALSAEYGESLDETIKPSKPPTMFLPNPDPSLPNTPNVAVSEAVVVEKPMHQIKPIQKNERADNEKYKVKRRLVEVKNYAIQLVALKNQQKIEELLALLRLHNYHAYIDKRDEEHIQRLFVGPYSSKEQAESTILDLHNLTKLKGIIITK